MDRVSKENYYLDIAEIVSERSTCLRRRFGSIIVKNDSIVATGYNGAPRGRKNCSDLASCKREEMNIPRGERYELCRSVHSEANAIIAAPRTEMLGATLYMCCTSPHDGAVMPDTSNCMMCKRMIINAGIEWVVIRDTKDTYRKIAVSDRRRSGTRLSRIQPRHRSKGRLAHQRERGAGAGRSGHREPGAQRLPQPPLRAVHRGGF